MAGVKRMRGIRSVAGKRKMKKMDEKLGCMFEKVYFCHRDDFVGENLQRSCKETFLLTPKS